MYYLRFEYFHNQGWLEDVNVTRYTCSEMLEIFTETQRKALEAGETIKLGHNQVTDLNAFYLRCQG